MIQFSGYELILGSSTDPQFGPVLLFGTGGQLVEVHKDSALGLPPLSLNLAKQLILKTNIAEALKGVRGQKPVDLNALALILVHFSQLVADNPRIKECDINPLLVSHAEMIALDARVVLHSSEITDQNLPQTAIRPYPLQYIYSIRLKNQTIILLRPIRPEDEPLVVEFHKELSAHSVRQRYFDFVSLDERVAHHRLVRICFNDYARELALVAETEINKNKALVGIARLSRFSGTSIARLTLIIRDNFHGKGLGQEMVTKLIEIASKEKIEIIVADVLKENTGMLHILAKNGFKNKPGPDQDIAYLELKIV
jgi:acetyltransferase